MLQVARGMLASRMGLGHVPLFVGAAITDRCDGQCLYCRRSGPEGEDMDTGVWIGLIQEMAAAGTCRLSLTGGEPLLREDVGRLVSEARARRMAVNLNTNGYRLRDRLDELARVDGVTVSFDGPSRIMDALRGDGAHRRAVAGIEAARVAGVPVSLRATLSRLNVQHVEAIVREASELGVRVSFAPLRTVPLGPDGDRDLLPDPDALGSAVDALATIKRSGDRTILNSTACLAHLRRWPTPTSIACVAGRVYARVEADGRVFACGDHVTGERHASALEHGFVKALALLEPAGCESCWCDARVEMNLVYGLNPGAALEALRR